MQRSTGRISSLLVFVTLSLAFGSGGCAVAQPAAMPEGPLERPATPKSVTGAHPGGDASDPEQAALERLGAEHWGARRDRQGTIRIALADVRHWTRVRLWGEPTRAAFRFGDEHYGVTAVWYSPAKGASDPESCLQRFIDEAKPRGEAFGVHVDKRTRVHVAQETLQAGMTGPVPVEVVDASIDSIFDKDSFAGAIASYPSWPGTCLIQGFMVRAAKHPELAAKVRNRWVDEAAPRLAWDPKLESAPAHEDR